MTIHLNTKKGSIKITTTFPLSRLVKRKITESLKLAVGDVKPIEPLLEKIREKDPLVGTPTGSLIAYMTSQGWTQQKLAKKTGITQGDISKMINGRRVIGPLVAKKLGGAFGVDYRKFL